MEPSPPQVASLPAGQARRLTGQNQHPPILEERIMAKPDEQDEDDTPEVTKETTEVVETFQVTQTTEADPAD